MNLRALKQHAELRIGVLAIELNCSLSSIRNRDKGRTAPKIDVWQVFGLWDLYQCTEKELMQAFQVSMSAQDT